ncbi:TlpA disulfide reductase family protein [Pedobacter sp. UYP1]|uniref:TlpA family protein disulfide reductase n=1 Tax=Pedobacter sp. UYP1 TaxID=1756396 RepID=UPI0033944A97
MKKTISIIAMATLCLFLSVTAQTQVTKPTYKPVKIGDRVPDVTLTNIYNYKTTKTNLSDFKAKLIILDFWATWCTSCLVNFPKIEKLQKKYGEEVQFIKVTDQSKAVVLPFLEKFHKDQPSVIPVITDDKILHELFPHICIPHYVWLDQSGKVAAATTGDELTVENIDQFLNNDNITNMRLKIDQDISKPLFITNELLKNNELKHSSVFFQGKYDGLGTGVNKRFNKAGKQTGLSITNMPLFTIYEIVATDLFRQRGVMNSDARSLNLVKDPSLITYKKGLGTRAPCFYTYDCDAAYLDSTTIYQNIFDELNRYSDYCGSIEKAKVKCLVLRRTSKIDKIKTNGGIAQELSFDDPNPKLVNHPLTIMMLRFSDLPFIKIPLIDETNYSSPVDIQISKSTNLTDLQKELEKYDLELKEQTRELDMFVLRDKN